jgi:hypothetical protein
MDYSFPGKRRKGKDKKRDKRKHPYKKGGKFRSSKVKE